MIKSLTLSLFIGLVWCEKTVAIFDFSNNGLSNNEVLTLTDRLRTELVQVSDYTIVERSKIDEILKEQKFQLSGCVEECLLEVGQILGANNIIIGSIGKIGNIYTISARMVNAESGKIIQAISYDSDYDIGNLLKYGMKECAYRLMDKKPPKNRQLDYRKQCLFPAMRVSLGYSIYLIILGLMPSAE